MASIHKEQSPGLEVILCFMGLMLFSIGLTCMADQRVCVIETCATLAEELWFDLWGLVLCWNL